jgi:hypothetical protein
LGRISNRLARLEAFVRERAVAELRRAWASLSDEELAIFLAPYAKWIKSGGESGPEWERVRDKLQAVVPDDLIARAVGLEDGMRQEEIDRRIDELVQALGIFGRGDSIRRHMQERRATWD